MNMQILLQILALCFASGYLGAMLYDVIRNTINLEDKK